MATLGEAPSTTEFPAGSDLPPDAAGVLTNDGAGGLSWQPAGTPGAHAAMHQNAGGDEISVAGLSGQLADAQPSTPALVAFSATNKLLGRATAGAGAGEEIACTAAGRALLDDADAAAQRTTLGLAALAQKATIDDAALIGDGIITLAKLVNIATARILGRTTAGSGVPEELTAAQATALLDVFTSVAKGLVPASGGGTSTFLRADGAFAAPPGLNTLKKTGDQTINGGAGVFVDITDLTFPVVNGTDYAFHFYITFQSAATATGWKAGVNCPAGALDFWAESQIIANGAAGVATHTERHNTVRDDMTLLTTTIAQAVDLAIRIEGRYKCTADGTFAARFANELAANTHIVVQKGSWGYYF